MKLLRHPVLLLPLAASLLTPDRAALSQVAAPEVVVRGQAAPTETEVRPADTLSGEDLRRQASGTLGETVSQMPGTHNASFGPAVGLPVIRGMSGPRVRIAVDGLGTHDASSLSPDHAVTLEPMIVDEVRVLRGPETVRYGSGAIGGAVEVSDGRIVTRRLSKGVEGRVEARYGSNGHERAGAARIRGGSGGLVLHADMFRRERGNLGIPGLAIDEAAVLQQFGAPTRRNTRESVANTDARVYGGGLGLSWVGDRLHLGASVGSIANNYGIPPGGHSQSGTVLLDPTTIEGQNVRIDMAQTRADVKSELFLDLPRLRSLRLRAGIADYRHDELDNGRVVTTFSNRAQEARLETQHALTSLSAGNLGLHILNREVAAVGQEAYIPRSLVDVRAAYLSEKIELGWLGLEGAYRTEWQDVSPDPMVRGGNTFVFPQTSYRPATWSLAATVRFDARTRLTGTLSRPQRAPEVTELYSFGPHLATRTYDVGNRNLRVESMSRVDLGLQHEMESGHLRLNAFRYEADGFIYLQNRGLFYDLDRRRIIPRCVQPERCLPVYQYDQQDAVFNGYEAEWLMRFNRSPVGPMEALLFTDAVRGRFTGATTGDVPRLPPRRAGIELTHYADAGWITRLRWTHAMAQDNPGANEARSESYDLVNLSVDRAFAAPGGVELTLYAQARNLLNEEIRASTSFLRSFAPEPGRRIDLGVRATF
jgi:iron complex outermembrane receptor protein